MKHLSIFLAILLILACLPGCQKAPSEEAPTASPKAQSAETEPPASQLEEPVSGAEILADFTVQTVDGGTFTLSEALRTHELVVINLFFTNCPPCRMEFPFLEEAWSQNSDRVAVIALSPDPTDTDEVLRAFTDELGLTFPVAHEEGTGLYERYVTLGFPTTMLVDRTGKVALVECGMKSSTEEFLKLFDGYTGRDYDPAVCTYRVYCYNVADDGDVAGVLVNFCTDTTCTPVTSAELGCAVFTGPPDQYHVQVVKVPDGWELAGEGDLYTQPYGESFWIPFREADK